VWGGKAKAFWAAAGQPPHFCFIAFLDSPCDETPKNAMNKTGKTTEGGGKKRRKTKATFFVMSSDDFFSENNPPCCKTPNTAIKKQ
jgi:hypothetical protein